MADAEIKTVEYTEPSPIPEIEWGWRRAYSYVVTLALMGHVGWLSWRIKDERILAESMTLSQYILVIVLLLYLAGASAEAIGKIIAAVRTSRKETVTSAPAPARIVTPEAAVTSAAVPEKPSWSR